MKNLNNYGVITGFAFLESKTNQSDLYVCLETGKVCLALPFDKVNDARARMHDQGRKMTTGERDRFLKSLAAQLS